MSDFVKDVNYIGTSLPAGAQDFECQVEGSHSDNCYGCHLKLPASENRTLYLEFVNEYPMVNMKEPQLSRGGITTQLVSEAFTSLDADDGSARQYFKLDLSQSPEQGGWEFKVANQSPEDGTKEHEYVLRKA